MLGVKRFLRRLRGQEELKEEKSLLLPRDIEVNNVILQKWEKIRLLSSKMSQTLVSKQEVRDTNKEQEIEWRRQQRLEGLEEEEKDEEVKSDYDEWYNSPFISKSPNSTSPLIEQIFSPSRASCPYINDVQLEQHNCLQRKSVKIIKKFVSYF